MLGFARVYPLFLFSLTYPSAFSPLPSHSFATFAMTLTTTRSFGHGHDNAAMHLPPTPEHHTSSYPAFNFDFKVPVGNQSQQLDAAAVAPAAAHKPPHTIQLPNDVASMAKLGVLVSVLFPRVSVFMVKMLPLVLLTIGMLTKKMPFGDFFSLSLVLSATSIYR